MPPATAVAELEGVQEDTCACDFALDFRRFYRPPAHDAGAAGAS